jgi:RHS repeat-associated protein
LDEEFPEVVFSPALAPAVAAKAVELGNDPVRIYEFVRNELEFQNYFGLMKGPESTLLTGGGNDYDLAALLVSLMRAAGVPARFVRGRIWLPSGEAPAWTGTDTLAAALDYLNDGTKFSWLESTGISLAHVWVEIQAPMAFYRGHGADPAMRGRAWIPLDPSYKLSEWSDADPSVPIGNSPELTLDYTSATGLYSKVQPKLPAELFENQVREYLAQHPTPAGKTLELEDVRMHATILEEAPGVLPNGLPYGLSVSANPGGGWYTRRGASLAELHVNATLCSGPSPYPSTCSVWPATEEYRYRTSVHVCNASITDCVNANATSKILFDDAWSVAWEGRPVLVTFPLADPNQVLEGTLPTLWVDGVVRDVSESAVQIFSQIAITVVITQPPVPGCSRPDSSSRHVVAPGGIFLASFDLHGGSEVRTRSKAQTLVDALADFPIVPDPNGAFVDADGDGVMSGAEKYLGADPDAQRELTGGLLDLANAWYWHKARSSEAELLALHHVRPGFALASGLVSAGAVVDYLYDIPFAIRPTNLLLDIKGARVAGVRRETGERVAITEPVWSLDGHHFSALEHAVWEEVAGFEAVSTVKGLQLGREVDDQNLLVLKTLAEANAATSSCNGTTCGAIDGTTYCTITASFPISNPASGCSAVGSGVTTELRILENSNFQYDHGWEGYVYFRATETSLSYTIAPTGQGSAGGAYATDFTITQPWNRDFYSGPLSTGFITQPTFGQSASSLGLHRDSWIYNGPHDQFSYAGDPVSVLNGNYYSIETDLTMAGRGGMDLRLVRSYNARLSSYPGPIGYGWTHTFDQHLRLDDGEATAGDERVVWQTETGAEVPWNDPNRTAQPLTLTAQPWVRDTLARNADGSYTLTTKDGVVYSFHAASAGVARLAVIRDRNGNTITCNYVGPRLESVTDSTGRTLDFVYDDVNRTVEIRDADWFGGSGGRTWRYQLDARGDLIEYWDPEQTAKEAQATGTGQPWRYTYYADDQNDDLDHNLKCWIRPQGGRTPGDVPALCGAGAQGHAWMHFAYYANDTVYKHTDALGHETSFSFNFLAKRTDVMNPDGSVESHFYDAYGNVTRHESARGVVREYEFDAAKREQIAERDGLGFESTAAYDTQGNRIRRVDRLGNAETWTYNDFGQVLSHRNRREDRSEWVYDAKGNLLVERAELDGELRTLREHTYDSYGNRVDTIVHRDLNQELAPVRTRLEYRANGVGVRRVVDGLGKTTRITLDELARPTRIERDRTVVRDGSSIAEPVSVESEYDRLDRAWRSTGPDGTISEVDFDANGLVAEVRTLTPQPLEERTEGVHAYDAMDRRTATTNALGHTANFAYDERDRLVSATTPLGLETTRSYDADGNLVSEVDPSGATARIEYDAEGRPERAIDPLGRVSRTEYDAEGRVTKQIGPAERTLATFEVDHEGNPTSRSDAEGRQFTTDFDEFGRPTSTTGPVGEPEQGTTLFEYDLTGLLLARTDADQRQIALRYDALGRMVESKDGLGRSTYFAFDELGNLVERVDGAGECLRMEHDSSGRVVRRTSAGSGSAAPIDDRYRFDGFGRLVLARNAHTTLTYGYDRLDRALSVTDSASGTAQLRYDADGRTVQAIYPNGAAYGYPEGVSVHYLYNARGQLQAVVDPVAGIWQLEYDAAGRAVRRIDPSGVQRRVIYDDDGDGYGFVERVEIARPGVSGAESFVYGDYDLLGNPRLIDQASSLPGGVTGPTHVAYDSLSRVRSVTYPGGAGGESFEYDKVGNRIGHVNRQNQSRAYTIDAAHQLTEIREGTGANALIERFVYDGAGRRRQRISAGNALLESYAYDARGALTEYTQASGYTFSLDYDATGYRRERSEAAGQARYFGEWAEHRGGKRRRMVFGSGLGAPLAEIACCDPNQPQVVRALHEDGTANVTHVAATSAGGAPAFEAARRYEAFGSRLSTGMTEVERSFAGRPTEGASGLLRMGARHYDPSTGTFLQVDPLVLETSQAYAYASQNPYRFWDPTGLRGNTINTSSPSYPSPSVSYASSYSNSPTANRGFGFDDAVLLGGAIGAGFIPGFGEALDLAVLADPGSTRLERGLAGVSLAANFLLPVLPNFGGIARASGRVADDFVVVRGGVSNLPPPGQTFSGAYGRTLEDAASGVPHGQIRASTASRIREGGGTVEISPELTRSGVLNEKHVNICLGPGPCPFGPLQPNPVPKSGRIQ